MKTLKILWIWIVAILKIQFNGKASAGPLALIKYGQIIAEARGKLAGTVFSRNTAGSYMRQKVSPIQPRTVAQQLVRALLTTVAQAWRGITEAQRLAWNTIASSFVNINRFGDNMPLTGFGLFSRLNRNRQEISEALLTDPPSPTDITGLTDISLVIDNAEVADDDKIKVTFAPAIPADQKAVVYMTPPLSAGKNFVKSEYRKLKVLDNADISPFPLGAAYIALYGAIPAAGTKTFIQMRPIHTASGLDGVAPSASDVAV
ncbi:MAG: hypothetical protein ACE5IW_10235 [bacterium]